MDPAIKGDWPAKRLESPFGGTIPESSGVAAAVVAVARARLSEPDLICVLPASHLQSNSDRKIMRGPKAERASGGGGPCGTTRQSLGKGEDPVQPIGPSRPSKRPRTTALRVRLTAQEREAIDAAAKKAGIGPCSYLRVIAVSAVDMSPTPPPARRRAPSESAKYLAKFFAELGRIGNNLNQCARSGNAGFVINPQALEEIRDDLRQLRDAILATQKGSSQ
jgi:hypothetical protein